MGLRNIILLVEDNADDADLTRRAFERSKVANTLVVIDNGEAALNYLHCEGPYSDRNPEEMPQVVLLDLNLPKMNGLEVLQRMRSDPRTKRTPVVVLTSSNEDRDLIDSYDLGANSYVRKPVDFAKFIEAAAHLGLYWLVLNTTAPK